MIPTTDSSVPFRGFNLRSYVLKQVLNLLRYILGYFKNCILRQDLAMLLKLAWSLRSPYLRLPVRWHCRTMAPCSSEHAHFKMDTNLRTLATSPRSPGVLSLSSGPLGCMNIVLQKHLSGQLQFLVGGKWR